MAANTSALEILVGEGARSRTAIEIRDGTATGTATIDALRSSEATDGGGLS
ncbi:hypothetical protein [Natronobacterium lacisalsi]|uniref:hypothetical protein n=1 Tax=Natronobacterium lacisalsi TaxID=229731 RepID=UPI0012EB707B|nr:hypothetical protein [Halobiforma lacisalsi]